MAYRINRLAGTFVLIVLGASETDSAQTPPSLDECLGGTPLKILAPMNRDVVSL
jgi:hypothetical protein